MNEDVKASSRNGVEKQDNVKMHDGPNIYSLNSKKKNTIQSFTVMHQFITIIYKPDL